MSRERKTETSVPYEMVRTWHATLQLDSRLKCAGMAERFFSVQDLALKQLLKFLGYISKEQGVNLSSPV